MRRAVGALCAAHPEWGQRPLRIVDVGGGKGFLARHLAEAFGANVSVVVLDRDARKIAYGQRAKAMPPNLEYVLGDASALLPGESGVGDVDVVVGLTRAGRSRTSYLLTRWDGAPPSVWSRAASPRWASCRCRRRT